MKAINCPQCGATIDDVSERSVIIDCEYCGARIMLDERRPEEKPRLHPVQVAAPDFEPADASQPMFKLVGLVVAGLFLVPIVVGLVSMSGGKKESGSSALYSAPPSPYPYSTPSSWSYTEPVPDTPVPVVNYQPRVSWDGPNDLEHFEEPSVDISSVSHLTSEEVRGTVFKNRVVKLRVVINTEGEIDEVETISGHPLLVDAATLSAKRSVFRSRSKPTTRVLIYTFRVLKD